MKVAEKQKAINLRRRGLSVKEIAKNLDVSQGSVSVWVRSVFLSESAKGRLFRRIKKGQFVAAEIKKRQTEEKERSCSQNATTEMVGLTLSKECQKLLCSLIYWCEGVKDVHYGMAFINSDPKLMRTFLRLLRASFVIDESKFRPLLHLHKYHDAKQEVDFWAKITHIDKKQFRKPYIKPNTGKRIREGYHGCLSLRYFSADLTRQLLAFAKAFFVKMGA